MNNWKWYNSATSGAMLGFGVAMFGSVGNAWFFFIEFGIAIALMFHLFYWWLTKDNPHNNIQSKENKV
jgi:hypothetical protein